MHKTESDQVINELEVVLHKAKSSIERSRENDASTIKGDIDDLLDRINQLERQRGHFTKYINDMSKALKDTMNDTVAAVIEFENNRKELLVKRLEEISGENYSGQRSTVVMLPDKKEHDQIS
jgi:regulator of replication initiation timing